MNIDEAFPSDYLAASDFTQPTQMIMGQVQMEELGNPKESKPVLYFQGQTKGLVLNKTNMKAIKNRLGAETNTWMGQPVWLFSTMVEAFGEMKPGIRVSMDQPQIMGGQQAEQMQNMAPDQVGTPAPLNNPPGQPAQTYPDGSPYPDGA